MGTKIKLTIANYSIWKLKMEDILYYKDLYNPMEKEEAKPDNVTVNEWKKMHQKVIGLIRQWVDISVFHYVATETDACTLWNNSKDLYKRKTT